MRMFTVMFFILATIAPAIAGEPAAIPATAVPIDTITPGAWNETMSLRTICSTKWGKDHRAVTAAMKRVVFKTYGYTLGNKDPRCPCEIDHRVSRELGGADVIKNLWPQPYTGPWNAHDKDRLENRLHVEMCTKKSITLDEARAAVMDWVPSYRKYFGEPKQ